MANKATVTLENAPVGIEFNPELLRRNVTPEVTVPTDLVGNVTMDTVQITNDLTVTGTITSPSIRTFLRQLDDVDDANPQDLSILQYDLTQAKWVARTETEFFDATIDAGFSDTVYVQAFDLDGGFA
jgi:hypothetical protein